MSDDISMRALSGSVGERTRAAIAAGCDVVLHCNGELGEMRTLPPKFRNSRVSQHRRAEAALAVRKRAGAVRYCRAPAPNFPR